MKRHIKTIIIALSYIAVWQLAAMAVGSALLLPSPLDTAAALARLAVTGRFWLSIIATLARVVAGFLAGMALGTALGFFTAFSPLADETLSPLRSIIRATPVTSFIILVLLWFTKSLTPAFIAFLMVLPIAWTNVRGGLLSTDPLLVEMAKAFRFSRGKLLWKVYAPSALPQFVAACTTGLGFAWKSGVAAEVIATPAFSIGKSIIESKLYLEIPELFAWTAAVVILSMLLEKLMLRVLRRANDAKA